MDAKEKRRAEDAVRATIRSLKDLGRPEELLEVVPDIVAGTPGSGCAMLLMKALGQLGPRERDSLGRCLMRYAAPSVRKSVGL